MDRPPLPNREQTLANLARLLLDLDGGMGVTLRKGLTSRADALEEEATPTEEPA